MKPVQESGKDMNTSKGGLNPADRTVGNLKKGNPWREAVSEEVVRSLLRSREKDNLRLPLSYASPKEDSGLWRNRALSMALLAVQKERVADCLNIFIAICISMYIYLNASYPGIRDAGQRGAAKLRHRRERSLLAN